MTAHAPRVRIGIVSYEVADRLANCLDALPAALDGLAADVVVVDNASQDGSADVAERHEVQLIRNAANVGYARGMNAALDTADVDVLVALNPDTVPPPGSLRRLVEVLVDQPQAAVVVPRLVHLDGRTQHSAHRFPWLPRLLVILLAPRRLLPPSIRQRLLLPGTLTEDRDGPVDWAIGAVHVMRRSMVGPRPYRERWFMYVEDLDLCWRLHRAGHLTWFVGGVSIIHEGSASAHQVFGDDPSDRWWRETYDWYSLERGQVRCRLYALVNALAATRRHLFWRPRDERRAHSWRQRARRHLAVALHGPEGPATAPGPAR